MRLTLTRKGIEKLDALVEAHRDLANVLYQQGEKAEARREFETVIRLDPSGKSAPWAKQALENWRW